MECSYVGVYKLNYQRSLNRCKLFEFWLLFCVTNVKGRVKLNPDTFLKNNIIFAVAGESRYW